MRTYHKRIGWNTWLGTDSKQGLPPNGVGSNTKLKCSPVVNATNVDNVVLHAWSEARALQSCAPHSPVEHLIEVNGVGFIINSLLKELDKVKGSFVEQRSIFNGDVINHVPRILLIFSQVHKKPRGLNPLRKARFRGRKLKRTFNKVLIRHSNGRWGHSLENGDCVRQLLLSRNIKRTWPTYALRGFNMLYQHYQLLLADETLET
jgi:hypothetical protein